MKKSVLCFMFLLIFPLVSLAYVPRGWLWHDETMVEPQKKSPEKPLDFNALSATDQVEALKAVTMEAIHAWDLEPTTENAKKAAEWIDYWSNQASSVASSYRAMLIQNPELDYHLTHPTESAALSITKQLETTKTESAIRALSERFGVFYFYQGNDPYEKAMSPAIQHFSDKYGVSIVPISVDGVVDENFANSRIDNGQAAHLNVTHFPALMLVDPITGKAQPLHYGFITEDALAEQFYFVASHFLEANT